MECTREDIRTDFPAIYSRICGKDKQVWYFMQHKNRRTGKISFKRVSKKAVDEFLGKNDQTGKISSKRVSRTAVKKHSDRIKPQTKANDDLATAFQGMTIQSDARPESGECTNCCYEQGPGECGHFSYRIGYEHLKGAKMSTDQQSRFTEWNTQCALSGSNMLLNQIAFKNVIQDPSVCTSTLTLTQSRRRRGPDPIERLKDALQNKNSVVIMSINYFVFPTDNDFRNDEPYFKPSNNGRTSHAICCIGYEHGDFIFIDSHAFTNVKKITSAESGRTWPTRLCHKRISEFDLEIPSSLDYTGKIWLQSAVLMEKC